MKNWDAAIVGIANGLLRLASAEYRQKANEITGRGHAEFRRVRGENVELISWSAGGYTLGETHRQ